MLPTEPTRKALAGASPPGKLGQESDQGAVLRLALLLFLGFFEKFAEFRNRRHVG
jgi:hypothetical protein